MSQLKLTADSGGGTVAIKGPASTTGNAALEMTVPSAASGTLDSLNRAGNILQVVSTTKTDVFSTTASAASPAAVTGLSVTITPSSTSNKILLVAHIGVTSATNNDYYSYFYFYRGGSVLTSAIGDTASACRRVAFATRSSDNARGESTSGQYLDSPSSTSALTYQIYCSVQSSGGSAVVNRDGNGSQDSDARPRGISTLTAMEVAA